MKVISVDIVTTLDNRDGHPLIYRYELCIPIVYFAFSFFTASINAFPIFKENGFCS